VDRRAREDQCSRAAVTSRRDAAKDLFSFFRRYDPAATQGDTSDDSQYGRHFYSVTGIRRWSVLSPRRTCRSDARCSRGIVLHRSRHRGRSPAAAFARRPNGLRGRKAFAVRSPRSPRPSAARYCSPGPSDLARRQEAVIGRRIHLGARAAYAAGEQRPWQASTCAICCLGQILWAQHSRLLWAALVLRGDTRFVVRVAAASGAHRL